MAEPAGDSVGRGSDVPASKPRVRELVFWIFTAGVFGLSNIIWPSHDGQFRMLISWFALVGGTIGILKYVRDYRRWRRGESFGAEDEPVKQSPR